MRRVFVNLGLVIAGLLTAILLAELALRVFGVSHPAFYAHDSVRGFSAHRPGAEGWFIKEGRSYVKINKDGLRDREHKPDKPEDTIRIAVLGDSFAQAFQVEMEDTFWSVMGHELVKCKAVQGLKIEVINFGVSGYGTGLEWITLQKHVWKYAPDIVLLAFFTGNDFSDNFPILLQNPSRPHVTLENGKLAFHSTVGVPLSRTARFLLDSGLMDRSYLVQTLYRTWRQLRDRPATVVVPRDTRRATQAARKAGFEFGLDDWVYTPPATPNQREAWLVTEALIRQMNREVMAGGARLFSRHSRTAYRSTGTATHARHSCAR